MPYFFVDSGGISKCLILVFDQSWGQRRIRGPPFPFSIFIGVLRLFQKFEVAMQGILALVAMQGILALPSPDLLWCDVNGEPLSFVGPTVPPQLVVSRPPPPHLGRIAF